MIRQFAENQTEKNSILKQKLLQLCVSSPELSIADIVEELRISSPTAIKFVSELIEEGWIEDLGKKSSSGGRRPSIFGLNPEAGYIVGVDLERDRANMLIMDFKGRTVSYHGSLPFTLKNSVESCNELCGLITDILTKDGLEMKSLLSCGIDLTGRVNSANGYSFTYFINEEQYLGAILEDNLKVPITVDNDSRAMAYGEYCNGAVTGEKDMLFVNLSWGLGMGMVLDGKLYYGKSGYSGEIGHFPMLSNNIVCHCGKMGCLETGASGSALLRIVAEKIKSGKQSSLSKAYTSGNALTLEDVLEAVEKEDVVAIEAIGEIGETLGRGLAGLINVFNPEIVVIGGKLTVGGEYLMLPLQAAIKKYSLNIVSKDTKIVFSRLGDKAGATGCCMIARSRFLGLM